MGQKGCLIDPRHGAVPGQKGEKMGTFINYHYSCVGDSKLIAKAAEAIEEFKNKHAKRSGNGSCDYDNEVEIVSGGLMKLDWTCYSTHSMQALIFKLKALTATSELTFFFYKGCTDGTNEGRLIGYEGDKLVSNIHCVADIGMQAMLDMIVLQEDSDTEALGRLIADFKQATSDWDPELFAAEMDDDEDEDEDFSAEMRAGLLGAAIGETLAKYPALLKPVHAKALASLAAKIKMAGDWMLNDEFASLGIKNGMRALLATVEKLQVAAVVKKPRGKASSAASQSVRL
jgi:hypothetical protein